MKGKAVSIGGPEEKKGLSVDSLRKQLELAGIDMSKWGVGKAKTLSHLQGEIDDGETELVTSETGELLRQIIVGGADVYYNSPSDKLFRLKEDRQVFSDGRERQRNTDQAISEKMKRGEIPLKAMVRGIHEELGIAGEINIVDTGTGEKIRTSNSYPGLETRYVYHLYEVRLNDSQYIPEGYVEEQADKNSYFVWEEVATRD